MASLRMTERGEVCGTSELVPFHLSRQNEPLSIRALIPQLKNFACNCRISSPLASGKIGMVLNYRFTEEGPAR